MTFEIALVLALVAAALVAFVREVFPIEVTALALLAALLLFGLVSPAEAFSGFSNKAVIAIGALLILSHALVKTGALELLADRLGSAAGERKWLGIALLLGVVSVLSGFLNNTAVVAIFIPLAIDLCRRLELSPSKVLIPLSYASIFGGTLTLIGTSTNLVVSSLIEDAGLPRLEMFEFSRLGAIFLVAGLAYVLIFARFMLPDRAEAALTGKYRMGPYLAEVRVKDDSPLVGHSCLGERINERYQVTVVAILRGEERHIERAGTIALRAGDVLIVQGAVDDLLKLRDEQGLELVPEVEIDDQVLDAGGLVMAEALITPTSSMIGKTLAEADFRDRFGGFVLAVRRVGVTLRQKIAQIRFRFPDSLLVLMPRGRLEELRQSEDLFVVSERSSHRWRGRFWWLVLVLLPLAVAMAALDVLEIGAAAGVAVVLLMLTGALTPQESYRAVNWPVIFLIAAFVPLGHAFLATGTADFLARGLLAAVQLAPAELAPWAALALVYLITSTLTQMVSNTAAAIIVVPICLSLAATLGVSPRPFVIAVCFAASAEFMTPMGYQTNLMVYGPGAYRFLDYTRFGAPLNLLFWLLATLLIPHLWPF